MSNYETDSYSSSSSSRNSNGKKLTQKLKRFSTFISKKIKTKLNTTTTTTTTNPCSSSLTATDIKDIDPLVEIKQEPSNMQKDKSHFKKRHSSYISSCTKTPPLSNTTPRSYFSSIELKNNNNNNNTSNGSYNKVDILKEQYYYDKNDNHDLDHLLSSSLSPPPRSQINKSKSTLITSGRKSTDDAGCVNQRHKPSLCRSNTLGTYYQYYHQYHRAKHLARPVSHSSENSDRYVDDGNTSVMTSATSFTTTTLTAVATPQTSTAAAHVLL
ncbi:hypothetical protein BDF20DRAFT_912683 [Mycotypha africana]|uniref:uncharacterized protein n=1 Tax=Mycotypha africana TaxID=64632 RepID=UPI002300ACAC|nr:uncharacterized protein BDF20DRAFT_912683 [Mycotypha africana]KAI8979061.1 hypothetical protein BDF20DRAFT_912683 [Mycotypha africana]